MLLQILDIDYFLNNNKPVIRIFGKTEENKPVCCFFDSFYPYFYVRPRKEEDIAKIIKKIKDNGLAYEEAEKFLPFGYQEMPQRVIKIKTVNPQDVPKLRALFEGDADIYEADILFKYRFMADFGLKGMTWMDIDSEKSFTRTSKLPSYRVRKINKPQVEKKDASLRYLAFDIECLPLDTTRQLDAKKDPTIMISLAFEPAHRGMSSLVLIAKPFSSKNNSKNTNTASFPTEKEMLEKFLQIVDEFDPDVVTGYNINNFDIPYLLERLHKLGLPQSFGRCDKPVFSRSYSATQEATITGRVVVDPYQILKRDPNIRFPRYNLNTVAKIMLNEQKDDVVYGDIPKLWNGGEEGMIKLADYARKDAELSLRLLLEKKILDKFFELSKISGVLLQDSLGGQATRIENMLLHEFKKRNILMPVRPPKHELDKRMTEKLKGATVLEPKKGLYSECVIVLDFQSLYPSIIKNYNVSPDSLLLDGTRVERYHESPVGARFVNQEIYEGVFPFVLKNLLAARIETKKKMKAAAGDEKEVLDARQHALKILANSFYGYCGYVRARSYKLEIANSITAYGRENIVNTKKLIEEKYPVEVIYGDTDSLFINTKQLDIEKANIIGEEVSRFISEKGKFLFEFEKTYKTFLILTKKRYAGWKYVKAYDPETQQFRWKDSIEMRGIETVRRDWCPLVTETMEEVIGTILKEGDVHKVITQVRDVVTKLNNNQIALEKLTVVKGITKSVQSYEGKLPHIELARKMAVRNPYDAPKVGDRLGFVIVRGSDLLSKRAEDPNHIRKHNLSIDADYYINNQLLPPIERILYAVGVERSELVGNGRQVSIADIFKGIKSRKSNMSQEDIQGTDFICKKCSKIYRRIPLRGICECGGSFL